MLRLTATANLDGKPTVCNFTSTVTRSILTLDHETKKRYRVTLYCNNEEAGHIEFKAATTTTCFMTKGDKASAVEFDNIGINPKFKKLGLSYLLIWCASMKASHKGYSTGNVKSISTSGSLMTFVGAGFPNIAAPEGDQASEKKIKKILARKEQARLKDQEPREEMKQDDEGQERDLNPDEKLRAFSGNGNLAAVRGECENKIDAKLHAAPQWSTGLNPA